MPRAGGEADKLGNRYESLWAVDAALDLVDGEYVDLTLEPVGDESAGIEFFRTKRSGVREYHSIKRQHHLGNWTIVRLAETSPVGRSILGDLIGKIHTGAEAVFSSGTSATVLEELIKRARASDSLERVPATHQRKRTSLRTVPDVRYPSVRRRALCVLCSQSPSRENEKRARTGKRCRPAGSLHVPNAQLGAR